MNRVEKGSKTAIVGFRNEDDVVEKFNNWRDDNDAKSWLVAMNYNLSEIDYVKAIKVSGYKTDVQIQVTVKLTQAIDVENIQVKLVSNPKGYNQIDKRWVDKYDEMWNMPVKIISILKRYTGEELPNIKKPKDNRRMFADEFTKMEQSAILKWLRESQSLIISDILKGRGKFAAEWMLVAQVIDNGTRWILKPMNFCLNYFGNGEVEITKKGNFKIGRITMQRKGGDGGRKTANMLQFKINPSELFEAE
jgi:hypothetical protein